MGYVFIYGECVGCHRFFGFHPHKVPSYRQDGVRQPICQTCVDRVNPMRKANGLPPIVPLPGAYEPADENEIVWD
jgi:hypothetical protein